MEEEGKTLVLMDVDKIKEFVFYPGRLMEIRGASSLLAMLNEEEDVRRRTEEFGGRLIYAGGGAVKAVFECSKDAEKFKNNEEELYNIETITASITGVTLLWGEKKKVKGLILEGEKQLKREKEKRNWFFQNPTNPYLKSCTRCGRYPATSRIPYPEEAWVCPSCEKKRRTSQELREPSNNPYIRRFLQYLRQKKGGDAVKKWEKASFFDDLSELGEHSSPKGYLGFIYADANRMGERLKELKADTDDEYKRFSHTIKEALEGALFEVLSSPSHFEKPIFGKIPFEIVILGGDEIVLITLAQKTLSIAKQLCQKFHQDAKYTTEEGQEKNVSISTGVVIPHSKYPIYHFNRFSEELTVSAKGLSMKRVLDENIDSNSIDYMVVNTPSVQVLRTIRDEVASYKLNGVEYKLTCKPFDLKELEWIISFIQELKTAQFPRIKLYKLLQSLLYGKDQSIFEFLVVANHLKENHRQLLFKLRDSSPFFKNRGKELFPWIEVREEGRVPHFTTPFPDILESYDFIEEE